MRKIKEVKEKYNLRPTRYQVKGNITLIDTESGRFILKEKQKSNESLFNYLNSRKFYYYPKKLNEEIDDYDLIEYIEEVDMPKEQKMSDLFDLLSLLHSKTTHYVEVSENEYEKLYEDIKNNIEYLRSYYSDYITIFEEHVFMSPSEYLFSRNYTEIINALNFSEYALEDWYNLVKEKTKMRHVVLHNNLDLSHFLKSDKSYFISWNKAKFDMPIFDLYKLYKRISLDYPFSDLLKRYEHEYPLLEEEKKLFFILISLPERIDFTKNEYEMCKDVTNMIEMLFKTENFISPYYSKKEK